MTSLESNFIKNYKHYSHGELPNIWWYAHISFSIKNWLDAPDVSKGIFTFNNQFLFYEGMAIVTGVNAIDISHEYGHQMIPFSCIKKIWFSKTRFLNRGYWHILYCPKNWYLENFDMHLRISNIYTKSDGKKHLVTSNNPQKNLMNDLNNKIKK